MKPLVFSEKSLDDLPGILSYIARDKPEAAVRFVELIERQCELLAEFPEAGEKREDLAAHLRLFTFRGYGIYFRNLDDRVRTERVIHGARDVTSEYFG